MHLSKIALKWFWIALIVRLIFGVILHIYSEIIGLNGFFPLSSVNDDRSYLNLSTSIYEGKVPEYLSMGYPFVLAFFFKFTGPSLILGKLINIIAGSLTVYVGVLIANQLSHTIQKSRYSIYHPANLTGLLLTFYPSALIHSTQLLKDPMLILFGLLAVYLSVEISRKRNIYSFLYWSLSIVALFNFRPYAAIAIVASLAIYLIFLLDVNLWQKTIILFLFILLSAVIPNFIGMGLFAFDYVSTKLNTEFISDFRENAYSTGESAADISLNFNNPISFTLTYGYSYITTMFGPFPWQIRSLVHIVALPEALFILCQCFSFRNRFLSKARREKIFLLICSSLLIGAISLFSDSIGANVRLRLLPWSIFLIYIALLNGKKNN